MPKAKKRKKRTNLSAPRNGTGEIRSSQTVATSVASRRSTPFTKVASAQTVLFAALPALGFWGLAVFCIFFYSADANHYLYGAIMALTAVGWSILVARRWSQYRQST